MGKQNKIQTFRLIAVDVQLLKDIYILLCSSSKMDWEDRVTSRLGELLRERGIK